MLLVELHLAPEQLGDRLLGEVVGRRPEAAGRDHRAGAIERLADGRGDLGGVVADGGPPHDVHADRRERAREVRGVRVDREAEQQLVADRDDFDLRRRGRRDARHRRRRRREHAPKLRR